MILRTFLQVYLPIISGHVPAKMVQTVHAFLDFCYIVHCNVVDTTSLWQLEDALSHFHEHQTIFQECEVHPNGFSLPHQHSLVHYLHMTQEFRASNGLCSSITKSKHIKAIKELWRRSSQYKALGQMLLTNQQLDKLAASCADFKAQGMLGSDVLQVVTATFSERKLYFILYIYHKLTVVKELQIPHNDHNQNDTDGSDASGPQTIMFTKLGKAISM